MIHFNCPGCGKGIKVGDTAAGKNGKCPACGAALHVPQAPAADTPAPPPLRHEQRTAVAPDDVPSAVDEPTEEPSAEVSQPASASLTGPIGTLRSFASDVLRRLQGLDFKGRIVLAIVVVVAVSVPTLMFRFPGHQPTVTFPNLRAMR